jgi:excisionase family DNA binding protein
MMKLARPRNPRLTSEDARKGREKALPSGRAGQVRQLHQGYATVFSSVLGPAHPGEGRESAMTVRTYESLASAAARMGVSVKTVRRRIADGVLPAYRCGRILRLDPAEVDGMFRRYPQPTAAWLGYTRRRAGDLPASRGFHSE